MTTVGSTLSNALAFLFFNEIKVARDVTDKEQQHIVSVIQSMHEAIQDFKKEKAPSPISKVKQAVDKELDKKDALLMEVQKKAQKGEASVEDLKEIKKEFSGDFNFSLFK
jgi:hypothetical protein